MKFSILTPVYLHSELRQRMLDRCVRSISNQTYRDFEHIIVNDGSRIAFNPVKDSRQVLLEQPHSERMIALNTALKASKGEWICFMDSDDEYVSEYLEAVSRMIEAYPAHKVFNFGSIHMHENYVISLKPPFKPAKEEVGHEIFRSGMIVNGTFVFHRSCYEKLGGFPHVTNCWDLASKAFIEFPEIKELFKRIDPVNKKVSYTELGNPVGQDYYYFYKLTRKYYSKPVDAYLYLVHPRQGHKLDTK